MNVEKIVDNLIDGVANGGATVGQDGQLVKLGIAVAAFKEFEYKCTYRHPQYLRDELVHWVLNTIATDKIREQHSFGIWVDDEGAIYCDLIEVLPQEQIGLAVLKAKSRNQRAIQLLHPNTTLWITEPKAEK